MDARRTFRLPLALVAALACAGAPPEPSACAPGAPGVPLAYEVHGPDGSRAFLQGSMHFVRGRPPALHPRVERGLRDAQVIVLELDPRAATPEEVARKILEMAMLPEGTHLRDVVSPETWQLFEARIARAGASGAPVEVLEALEPWAVALTLIVGSITQVGFDARSGTEQVALAVSADKRTLGLETAEQQLSLFDSLSAPAQEELLRGALEGHPDNLTYLEALASAWRCGDAVAVEAAIDSEIQANPQLEAFYEATIFGRNAGMAAGIADVLREESGVFVVVGAAHLVGSRGIPALLEQTGFRVEPMRRKP